MTHCRPMPNEAREAGKEGDLEMVITVAPSGDVVGARVSKSIDPSIDQVAVATVRSWKFKVSRGEQATFPNQVSLSNDLPIRRVSSSE